MSERTHSPEGTPQGQTVGEFTTAAQETPSPQGPAKKRFSGKQKLAFLAGGTIAIAVAAIGLFQFLKQDEASAGTGAELAQQAAQQSTAGTHRPLARVGKQVIPWEVVAEECMIRYGDEVLENIINRWIILQACQDKGITVTKEEVDQEVMRIAKKFNLTPDNWYAMLQAERNLTPMQYQRDVIWPMLALKKIAGNKIDVTEADLQKAFESAYGERVMAKMIMLDNMRRAQDVWSQAKKNPNEFETLAKDHSIEPNSKSLGGTIPPIRKYGGNKELEDKAFAMKVGEISAIIQVGASRFVILKCEGRTEPHVRAMTAEIRQELYNALVEEKTQESVARVFNELKEMARVDNYLKGTVTGGNVQPVSHEAPGTARAGSYSQQPPVAPRSANQTPGTLPAARN
jgi:foldase protein PrsA